MPNWKKVIVSGSNVSQLNNDGVYLRTIGDGILSSSAQIASEISGAFTAASASLSNRIDNITGTFASTGSNSFKGVQTFSGSLLPETTEVFGLGSADYIWAELYVDGQSIYMRDTATNTFVTMSAANGVLTFNNTRVSAPLGFLGGILSSSAQIASEISGAFTATSGGFSTRVTSLENAVNNTTFSASIQERVTYNETDITALDVTSSQLVYSLDDGAQPFSVAWDRYDGSNGGAVVLTNTKDVVYNFTSSANTRLGNLEAATSSYALKTAITGAFAAPSSSFSTRVTSLEGATSTYALKTAITGAFTAPSSSFSTRVTSLEAAGGSSFSSSVSTRLTSVEGYTLDNVTDNGSTTTNGITIGGLTVNGDATITGTLTAQRFNTELVSSSIIYESGSTKFGDTSDDIHSFTGSVKLNTQTAATTDTDKFLVFDTGGQIKYRTGAEVLSDINPGGLVSSSAQLTTEFDTRYLNTTGDGVISSSAQLTTEFDTRYLNTTGDGVISSSAQIATQISGAFTQASGGFSTRITSLEAGGYVDVGTAASSSRIAIWEDGNTIGASSTLYYNSTGLIVNNGRTVGVAAGSSWSTGTLLVKIGTPVSSVGAFITYTLYRADATRSNMRAGNITAAWNYDGSSITFNETTTADIGTVPATITNTIALDSGDIYLTFTNNSGTLYSLWVNVDTMGLY